MNMGLTFKLKVLNLDLPKNFLDCNSQKNSWLDYHLRAPFAVLTKKRLSFYLDLQALSIQPRMIDVTIALICFALFICFHNSHCHIALWMYLNCGHFPLVALLMRRFHGFWIYWILASLYCEVWRLQATSTSKVVFQNHPIYCL